MSQTHKKDYVSIIPDNEKTQNEQIQSQKQKKSSLLTPSVLFSLFFILILIFSMFSSLQKSVENKAILLENKFNKMFSNQRKTIERIIERMNKISGKLIQIQQDLNQKLDYETLNIQEQLNRLKSNIRKEKLNADQQRENLQQNHAKIYMIEENQRKIVKFVSQMYKNESAVSSIAIPHKSAKQLYSSQDIARKKQYQNRYLDLVTRRRHQFNQVLWFHKYNFELNSTKDNQPPYAGYNDFRQEIINQLVEKPICLIIPRYLKVNNFDIEHSLNSIFSQRYQNYRIVIFSSGNQDIDNFVKSYLRIKKIQKSKYTYVEQQNKPIVNIYNGVHKFCQQDSMVFVLEGGKAFLGKDVFRFHFYNHHLKNLQFIFSNHFKAKLDEGYIGWGLTSIPVHSQVYESKDFRNKPFYQSFSFLSSIFKAIELSSFKNEQGEFYDAYITPIVLPLLQLSCRKEKIGAIQVIQNVQGSYWEQIEGQKRVFDSLRNKKAYSCIYDTNSIKIQRDQILSQNSEQEASNINFRLQKGGIVPRLNGDFQLFDLHYKDNGKTLIDILYKEERDKNIRLIYHQKRQAVINIFKNQFPLLPLAQFNFLNDQSKNEEEKNKERDEYIRLNKLYDLETYKSQLPLCILVPTHNIAAQNKIEYSLNSIFRQNYSNYFVAIINSDSEDKTNLLIRQYLDFYHIPKNKYINLVNQKIGGLQAIYNVIHRYCSIDSVAVQVYGGDELIGKNTFQLLNANYQRLNAGFIYTKKINFRGGEKFAYQDTFNSLPNQPGKTIRELVNFKAPALRSYSTRLFRSIPKNHFTDQNENFYRQDWGNMIAIPIIEKACGRAYFIQQGNYLFNNYGNNYFTVKGKQRQNWQKFKKNKKYSLQCDYNYLDKLVYQND